MKNYFDLTGQVAVVTGCSTGLGVQMAKALANQGAKIVAIARRKEKIDAVAKEISDTYKIETLAIQCDITDTENIKMFVNDRFVVDFGNKYDFSGKFSQLEAMVKSIDADKTGRIDLSEWSKDNTRGYFVEAQLN